MTVPLSASGTFNFTTINVPAGVTVKFTRNAANTPVTLLATGAVTIAGTIDVSGSAGLAGLLGTSVVQNAGAGGPGGFDGGNGTNALVTSAGGSGLGPGGGLGSAPVVYYPSGGGGGGYATAGGNGSGELPSVGGPAYGTPTLLPLIGGSGGAGGSNRFGATGAGGGGGGGALYIASSGTITLTGALLARGGAGGTGTNCWYTIEWGTGGGGSGGALRLSATALAGAGGTMDASGGPGQHGCNAHAGDGGQGRIRVETHSNTASISFVQVPSFDLPSVVTLANTPTLRITTVAGIAAPASPTGSFTSPDVSLPAGTGSSISVGLQASNIPLGTRITVRVAGLAGAASSLFSTALAGTVASSTASATVTIPTDEPAIISASATFPRIALGDGGPLFAEGEAGEEVRVVATQGRVSRVGYVTRSAREVWPRE
jgi:hypothetical protein